MNIPPDEVEILEDGFRVPEISSIDLSSAGISAILRATGYSFESLVNLPLIDEYGYPIADRGVTRYPGLYFLGMPWMNAMKSGFILGISDSAQYLAEVISR